jgi:hypothetical protein
MRALNWGTRTSGQTRSLLHSAIETLNAVALQLLKHVTGEIDQPGLRNQIFATMAWSEPDGMISRLLSGDPLAILIAFVVSFSLPLLLHLFLYRASNRVAATPTFLLLGISGAGKTSLLTLVSSEGFRGYPFISKSSRSATKTILINRQPRTLTNSNFTNIPQSEPPPTSYNSSWFQQVPIQE